MAIYSVRHSTVGRTTHAAGTAGAHADYIEREQACRITFGEHMPTDRGETRRWLDEQETNDRKNARVIDKLTLALPLELDAQQRVELIRSFVGELSGGQPVPWLAAIHDNDQDADNPHCHLILRDRHIETGKRALNMSEKGSTDRVREVWEQAANHFLEMAGSSERIDRRSLKDQGIDREPQKHIGPVAKAIEADGRESWKIAAIRDEERARNAALEAERAAQDALEAERAAQDALEAERAAQDALEAERAAQDALEAERAAQEAEREQRFNAVGMALKEIASPDEVRAVRTEYLKTMNGHDEDERSKPKWQRSLKALKNAITTILSYSFMTLVLNRSDQFMKPVVEPETAPDPKPELEPKPDAPRPRSWSSDPSGP